ncbi:nuclear transport factor 2 family protein [Streptomyces sp. NBC_00009]|uniref:nuclear transport factor 2 family protein n=1 Tax=Streptomyces sp. NBC_00009 TaxID=2975620 RepID=UPI00324E6D9A
MDIHTGSVEINLATVQKFFEYYATSNHEALRSEVLSEGAAWIVPGNHPLSGVHVGLTQIIHYYECLAFADLRVETLVSQADENWAIELQRVQAAGVGGCGTVMTWLVSYRFQDGRIVEGRHIPTEQALADQFFRGFT